MKKLPIFFTVMVIITLLLSACAESTGNGTGQSGSEGGFGQPGALSEQGNDNAPGAIPNTGDDDSAPLDATPSPDSDGSGSTEDNNDDQDDQEKDDKDKDKKKDKDKDKDKGSANNGQGNDDKDNDDDDRANDGEYALEEGLMPLSALDGATVLNRGGNPIGTIDGVVMDEDSGQVPYVIFDPDDEKKELGLEGQSVAIPLSALGTEEAIRPEKKEDREREADRAVLVFDRDESMLKDAPAFENDDELTGEMDDVQAYWQGEAGTIPVTGDGSSIRRMSLDDFENIDVYNREGEQVGTIRDIVVDPASGETRYFLVEMADGSEDGYLLIPADQFSREGLNDDQRGFMLAAEPEVLDQAPRIKDREELYRFGK